MRYERTLYIGERHRKLLGLLRTGRFSTPLLARRLGVSEPTIYRDITSLRERGYPIRSVKQGQRWAYCVAGNPATANTRMRRSGP